jgi:hypothetical protein
MATGPFGALGIMMLILAGIYKVATTQAFPLLKEYVQNQQKNVEAILSEHKKDRETFEGAISQLTKRQAHIEQELGEIKTDIKTIKGKA